MKKYVRTIPFSKKNQMILKLSEFMCGCICTVRKKEWKDHCDFGYRVPKTYFSQRNQTTITLSQLSKDASNVPSFTIILHIHRQTNCCSETFIWKFCKLTLFNTLWNLQSLVVAFNEHVKNTEKSKTSFVEVVSCFATVKARIQVRQSDVHIKSSQISTKRTLRRQKLWLWFIHVRYICIVSYKSCVTHLAKWSTLFAEFKCFD